MRNIVLICVFIVGFTLNNSCKENNQNKHLLLSAIQLIESDSLFVSYKEECSNLDSAIFKMENYKFIALGSLFFNSTNLFKNYFSHLIDTSKNDLYNLKALRKSDSIRIEKEGEKINIDFKRFKYYNSNADLILFFDILDGEIISIKIESIECPYKGIVYRFKINAKMLKLIESAHYNY